MVLGIFKVVSSIDAGRTRDRGESGPLRRSLGLLLVPFCGMPSRTPEQRRDGITKGTRLAGVTDR